MDQAIDLKPLVARANPTTIERVGHGRSPVGAKYKYVE
jgi:hypothetical protein